MKKVVLSSLICVLTLFSTSCKKRCPHDSCQTKMVHTHSGEEFRGRPWYKKQNPRTGELDPVLNRDGKKY